MILLGNKTDGTKEYHLWHCALRMPNLSSLPNHGFECVLSSFVEKGKIELQTMVRQ